MNNKEDTDMETECINPRYKQEIIKAVEYHFPQAKIILFGSRARKTHREGADVDIAIDLNKRVPGHEMARLRVTLENTTIPLFVDVVDMQAIPQILKDTIMKEGVVWKN